MPGNTQTVVLRSSQPDKSIDDSAVLILQSDGYASEAAARDAGERASDALLLAFARLRVGVDAGLRAPGGGGFTQTVLDEFWEKHGIRVINESNGLMVFRTEPAPAFSEIAATGIRVVPGKQFSVALAEALSVQEPLSTRMRVAIDVFHGSFFQDSADSRLLLLVMAVEVLMQSRRRAPRSVSHLRLLVALTRLSPFLSGSDRQSLTEALERLKNESIRQTGIRLVTGPLAGKTYSGKSPKQLFDQCYDLRSRLVHGRLPLPETGEVGVAAANLEVMVSDLLTSGLPALNRASG